MAGARMELMLDLKETSSDGFCSSIKWQAMDVCVKQLSHHTLLFSRRRLMDMIHDAPSAV